MGVLEFYALHNRYHANIFTNVALIFGLSLGIGILGLFLPRVDRSISKRDMISDFITMILIKFGFIGAFLVVKDTLARLWSFEAVQGAGAWSFYPLASYLNLPPILSLSMYLVVRDLGQWLKHRAIHKIPCLWAIHKIHHANRSLSIFANYRIHVLEVALSSGVTLLTLVITGYPSEYAFIAISLEEIVSMLNHSNLRMNYGRYFSKILTSPQNHRIHHSRETSHLQFGKDAYNFAILFPVWDIMNGSYYSDVDDYPAMTGVQEEEALERAGIVGRQWIGFRDLVQGVAKPRPAPGVPR